jgi:hypothetical protein
MGVFAVAVRLLLYASGSGAAQKAKQVQATLDSALATESQEMRDQIVNLRKNEQFSAIPWINNRLSKLELGPQLASADPPGQSEMDGGQPACHVRGLLCNPGIRGSLEVAKLAHRHGGGSVGFLFPHLFVLFKRSKRFKAHLKRSCLRPAT